MKNCGKQKCSRVRFFASVEGNEVTVKILEQKEGVKVPLGGVNSLDGISAVLISLKPSGLDVYVFQLSIMQSSCWSILNKPLLHSLHRKAARFTSSPGLFGFWSSFPALIRRNNCCFCTVKMTKAKRAFASNAQLLVKRSGCRRRVKLNSDHICKCGLRSSGAAYFSGRPTTDKANNAGTRTDHSSPRSGCRWGNVMECPFSTLSMWFHQKQNISQCCSRHWALFSVWGFLEMWGFV